MPKNWGSHLGIIDMQLELDGGKWKVKDASAKNGSDCRKCDVAKRNRRFRD